MISTQEALSRLDDGEQTETPELREMKRRYRHLADRVDDEVLSLIEERFETNLPCFQGSKGNYDPLDAMRRDAYREVVLWLRNVIKNHKS